MKTARCAFILTPSPVAAVRRLFLLFAASLLITVQASAFEDVFCDKVCSFLSAADVSAIQNIRTCQTWVKVRGSLASKVRTGWLNRGIPQSVGETVLEHSIKVAKAASIYAKHVKGVDLVKAERMALVHDLAEHEVPDFTPQSGIADADKHSLEKAAFEKLLKEEGDAGLVLLDLWLEYEAGTSPEARIVKQLDKFDAVVQALVYEDQGYPRMQEFYDYTRPKLVDRPLIHIFEILMERDYAPARAYELYFDLLEANGDPQLLQKQYRKNR